MWSWAAAVFGSPDVVVEELEDFDGVFLGAETGEGRVDSEDFTVTLWLRPVAPDDFGRGVVDLAFVQAVACAGIALVVGARVAALAGPWP